MEKKYKFKSIRLIDGKQKKVIVDICGDVINSNPTKEDLKYLRTELSRREICNNEEYLLEFLRYFDKKEGRAPKVEDFINNTKYPGFAAYQRLFGGWNKAIEIAGLWNKRKIARGMTYTDEDLLYFGHQFYEDNGRIPIKEDFDNDSIYPCSETFCRHFGNWPNFIKYAGLWSKHYNSKNACHRCIEDGKTIEESQLSEGYTYRENDKDGRKTGEWICSSHWHKDYNKYNSDSINNIQKSLRNSRTGNIDPNSTISEGNITQKLVHELYGWIDLNKENDNYNSPIDFLDGMTGLLYQIQGRRYNSEYRTWNFTHLENDWYKQYKDMILFCKSKDGKIIEDIYKIPFDDEIKKKIKSITIVKNPMNTRGTRSIVPWYRKYRTRYSDELKKANEILKKIIEERR